MKIITRLADLDVEVKSEMSKEEIIQQVFKALQVGFQDQAVDGAYFSESFSENSFIFGFDAPEEVCQIARSWNQHIKIQFIRSLEALGCSSREPENLPMDTPETYNMQKAARELDNNWWTYANRGVYLNNEMGFPYFQVVLPDKVQADMVQNPGGYVVADLYVKD